MLKKILGLPVRLIKKILGKKDAPAPKSAPTAPRPRPPAAPRPPAEEGGQDHGHSHGHAHDHGHDHGHAEEPTAAPAPAAAPKVEKKVKAAAKPAAAVDEDRGHGHSHDHGHDHGHTEPPAAAGNVRVEASDTPNPNARKFTCSVTVVEKGSLSFQTADEAKGHPIGRNLWGVGGVKGIFAVKDFITVTKEDAADWTALTPKLVSAIQKGLSER